MNGDIKQIKLEWEGAEEDKKPIRKNPEEEEAGIGNEMGRNPNGRSGRSQKSRELAEVEGAAIMGGSHKTLEGNGKGGSGTTRRPK